MDCTVKLEDLSGHSITINPNKMKKLKQNRGFDLIEFKDSNGVECSLQESSRVTPHIWLGCSSSNAKVMAINAEMVGLKTKQKTGWIDYPIPEEVSTTTRMHLNRKQAKQVGWKLICFWLIGRI